MRFTNRRSATRWITALLLVVLLVSAACSQSGNPLDSQFPTPDYSHAAGEGYIGPAASANSRAIGALASPEPPVVTPTLVLGPHR